MKINTKLMAHLVAGYTTDEVAYISAKALIDGGASILEVQMPFSDPSADGKSIQNACANVLSRGYKTRDALNFIKKIHIEYPHIPIFLMCYASLVFTPGIKNFVASASDAGVSALIVPDLPFDSDEGLTSICLSHGMDNIIVAAPSMNSERIDKLVGKNFNYIYAALRSGITGQKTIIDKATIDFIEKINRGGAKVLAGFGISTCEQARQLQSHVYAVVAGSVFVNIISEHKSNTDSLYEALKLKASELSS